MKIAIIEPVGGHGGMNYYDFSLAKGLITAGAEVIVYTCDKTVVPPGLSFEVKQTFNKIWGDGNKLVRAVRFAICLFRTLLNARRQQVELIHYHFFHYTKMETLCVSLAQLFGFRIVVTAHDVESFAGEYSDHAAGRILARVDKVIAHNNVSRRELIEKANLPAANIAIIPHGNYLNAIPKSPSPATARKMLNLAPKDPVLLFFGQIKEVKGLDLLLQALPQVVAKFPTLKLLIAGKVWKDDFSKYTNLIKGKNLQDNIDLHIGYIPDEDVAIFYRSADLVVLPYRRIYQSGVLLMAMSYGLPVMVSDLEGMVEIIQDNINGFIFKTGDVESLSSNLIDALNDPDRLKRIASHGFEKVVHNHDWKIIGKKTVELYKDTLYENCNPRYKRHSK